MKKSMIVEAALAGLFAAAFVVPAAAADQPAARKAASKKKGAEKVHCFGVNACKGTSECAVDGKSACHGKNACKGQGWVSLTAKSCKKKRGTVPAAPPAAKG